MVKENILFLRNRPRVFNLGDFLCTPLYYFDFFCNAYESAFLLKNKPYKVILGGGAFNDLGVSLNLRYEEAVAWGIGSSIHGKASPPTNGDSLPYRLYGLRDPDAVKDPEKLLPCVSCLHPIAALEPGTATTAFLNFDRNITDLNSIIEYADLRKHHVGIFTNYLDELQFMRIFSKTKQVITNSYHISYWSLLSGRDVAIIGYSSKFRSLAQLTGITPDVITEYDLKNKGSLGPVIAAILALGRFANLKNYREVRENFIQKNIRFAKKCCEMGFIREFRLRPHSAMGMFRRNITYKCFEAFAKLLRRRG